MLLLLLAPMTHAQDEEEESESAAIDSHLAGHGFVEFRLSYYDTSDGGGDGNPFLDEDLTVVQPALVYDYNLTDNLGAYAKLTYDYVSAASIDRLSTYPNQTGASSDNYIGGEIGFRYRLSESLRTGGFVSASTDYDYNSLGLGVNVAQDLADQNATVKLSLSGFFDSIDLIRGASMMGMQDGTDNRTSISSTLSWYQIIDPYTHGEFGTTVGFQNGFLETPYNDVVIEDPNGPLIPSLENARGIAVTEELDDSRIRVAIFGKARRDLGSGWAAELGGRVYGDSWGIESFAVEPRVYKWLVKDTLSLRARYRFYAQTAADDYEEHFFVQERNRTQDSDLGDFSSHGFGLKLNWYATDTVKFDISGDYILRDDGLNQILASLGIVWKF